MLKEFFTPAGAAVMALAWIAGAPGGGLAGAPLAAAPAGAPSTEFPQWLNDAGARRPPAEAKGFAAKSYGAVNDGKTLSTEAIQQAIDACSGAGGGRVTFEPGTYLTGALFLKDNVHWENITAQGQQAGAIDYAANWTMKNVKFSTATGEPVRVTNSENVAVPEVVKAGAAPPPGP